MVLLDAVALYFLWLGTPYSYSHYSYETFYGWVAFLLIAHLLFYGVKVLTKQFNATADQQVLFVVLLHGTLFLIALLGIHLAQTYRIIPVVHVITTASVGFVLLLIRAGR